MRKNALFTLVPLIALGFGLAFATVATPGHSYISIPAAAFQEVDENNIYVNDGKSLTPSNAVSEYYVSDVQLPHGATVSKLTFYFYDMAFGYVDKTTVTLYRTDFDGSETTMAYAESINGGASSTYDDTIVDATIDNSQYGYYLKLFIPLSTLSVYGVVIEYTYPVSLPAIMK